MVEEKKDVLAGKERDADKEVHSPFSQDNELDDEFAFPELDSDEKSRVSDFLAPAKDAAAAGDDPGKSGSSGAEQGERVVSVEEKDGFGKGEAVPVEPEREERRGRKRKEPAKKESAGKSEGGSGEDGKGMDLIYRVSLELDGKTMARFRFGLYARGLKVKEFVKDAVLEKMSRDGFFDVPFNK